MAAFMTRVELHNAKETDYETLHTAMEAEGFSRTITGSDNVVYHLPTAEYYRVAQFTRQQVLDSAKRAADKTKGMNEWGRIYRACCPNRTGFNFVVHKVGEIW